MSTIYERIRALREQKEMSQAELAILAGYKDRSSIAKIEAGKVDLPKSKIEAFARIFSVSQTFLINGEEEAPAADALQDPGKDFFTHFRAAYNNYSDKQIEFMQSISRMSDDELDELTTIVQYVLAKREK